MLRLRLHHHVNGLLEAFPRDFTHLDIAILGASFGTLAMPLMPAFQRFPEEATIIGRILAAYGELEFMLALCLGRIVRNQDIALKTYFRLRSESSRLEALDPILRDAFANVGLQADYQRAIGAMRHSLRIRNHFAHCHWADDRTGLYFTNLQDAADATDGFEYNWRHVDKPLLERLDNWLYLTAGWLAFLEHEYAFRTGQGSAHEFPRPKAQQRPNLHNPPEEHVSLWLSEDQQRRHLERALAAKHHGSRSSRKGGA